ncbi:MAG: hypothetical protein H7A21_14240 [Spirochaetales bacterium]|nr:hypothetical protein [Leptospiraceae bacterium]MCP5482591.1 hypothetical protein [Spirochaetales bacterium]MCP5485180.1 hypothetical protein [Spirochaetales bacterium]
MCHSIARRARSVLFVSALLALFLTGRCVRYETSTTDITEYPAELLVPLLTGSGSGGGGSGGGASPVFYMYTDSALVTGGQGTRAASTASCQTMQTVSYASFPCTSHLAVMSYSGGDDLASAAVNHSVPTTRALTSSTGTEIAPDWANFLSGPTITLQAAGVANVVPTPFYWSSSAAGGTYQGTWNCSNNTDGTMGSTGTQGSISTTAASHISFAVNQPCDGGSNTGYLMCMCWN